MKEHQVKIIGFTGLDGTGKSTQIISLQNHLVNKGFKVKTVHQYEPVFKTTSYIKNKARKFFSGVHKRFIKQGTSVTEGEIYENQTTPNIENDKTIAGRLLSCWWLISGVWRSKYNYQSNKNINYILLDRCYIDELVRSQWKTNSGKKLGKSFIRLCPKPDLVFYFYGDESKTWDRKKEKNSTRKEYDRKKLIVEDLIHDLERIWPIQKICIDNHDVDEISRKVFQKLKV